MPLTRRIGLVVCLTLASAPKGLPPPPPPPAVATGGDESGAVGATGEGNEELEAQMLAAMGLPGGFGTTNVSVHSPQMSPRQHTP